MLLVGDRTGEREPSGYAGLREVGRDRRRRRRGRGRARAESGVELRYSRCGSGEGNRAADVETEIVELDRTRSSGPAGDARLGVLGAEEWIHEGQDREIGRRRRAPDGVPCAHRHQRRAGRWSAAPRRPRDARRRRPARERPPEPSRRRGEPRPSVPQGGAPCRARGIRGRRRDGRRRPPGDQPLRRHGRRLARRGGRARHRRRPDRRRDAGRGTWGAARGGELRPLPSGVHERVRARASAARGGRAPAAAADPAGRGVRGLAVARRGRERRAARRDRSRRGEQTCPCDRTRRPQARRLVDPASGAVRSARRSCAASRSRRPQSSRE